MSDAMSFVSKSNKEHCGKSWCSSNEVVEQSSDGWTSCGSSRLVWIVDDGATSDLHQRMGAAMSNESKGHGAASDGGGLGGGLIASSGAVET